MGQKWRRRGKVKKGERESQTKENGAQIPRF